MILRETSSRNLIFIFSKFFCVACTHRQSLRMKWHFSSSISTEILLRKSATDLLSINATKTTKVDGNLREFSWLLCSIFGTLCDSHVDRVKYNSLSNVRPGDRQVGTFPLSLRVPSFFVWRKVVASQGHLGPT